MLRKNIQSYQLAFTECCNNDVRTYALFTTGLRRATIGRIQFHLNKTRLYVDQHRSSELLDLLYSLLQ